MERLLGDNFTHNHVHVLKSDMGVNPAPTSIWSLVIGLIARQERRPEVYST